MSMKLDTDVAQQTLTIFFSLWHPLCDKFISAKLSFQVERLLASAIN